MAAPHDTLSMALFCDFENVALGVRDANFDKFDIKPILERLLLKGSIVVKKAYCDWDRYKTFKAAMHEANFELIEIPHVRQSGKNSADIRLVVDALDLCYTKSHVNTFVIISGDSDFSPLVSKLRENAKQVIGVGVKQSTSDLLIANCDEFIFYDDLVRETRRTEASREKNNRNPNAGKKQADENKGNREEIEARKTEAIDMAIETFDALISERGDSGKIWASVLKNAIKRRKPDFNEGNYGFRTFGALLEEAQARGQLQLSRDDKSGTYVYRSNAQPAPAIDNASDTSAANSTVSPVNTEPAPREARPNPRRNGRGNRNENRPSASMGNSAEATGAAHAGDMPGASMAADSSNAPASDPAPGMTSDAVPATDTGLASHPAENPLAADNAAQANQDEPGLPTAATSDTGAEPSSPANPVADETPPRETRHERGRRTQTGRRPVKPKNKPAPAQEALSSAPDTAAATAATAAITAAAAPASRTDQATAAGNTQPPAPENTPKVNPVSTPATETAAVSADPAPAKQRTTRPARPRKPKNAAPQE